MTAPGSTYGAPPDPAAPRPYEPPHRIGPVRRSPSAAAPGLDREVFRRIADGTGAGVAVVGRDLRYLYVNDALARMTGRPAAEHLGRTLDEILPGVEVDEELIRAVIADGRSRDAWSTGNPSGGEPRHWHCAYHRIEAGGRVLGYAVVVTEISEDRRNLRELARVHERLLLLDAAALRIGTTLEIDRTCQELAELLAETIADIATVEIFPMSGTRPAPPGVVRLRRSAMASAPGLQEIAAGFGEPGETIDYQAGSAVPRSLAAGEPVVVNHADDAGLRRAAPDRGRVGAYRSSGIHSGMIIPLVARGTSLGTASLVRAGDSKPFSTEDAAIGQALARRAAISLDNARRYTREHGIALELQRSLLADPRGTSPDLEIATRYLPAGEAEMVGGDWYDAVPLPDGRTLLAMGDVMGHGVEAAVAMSHYRLLLRLVAPQGGRPDEMLARMDGMLAGAGLERPATCLLALVDTAGERCTFASAGHLPPAVADPDGTVRLLDVPPGPPLAAGTDGGGSYPVVQGPCAAGGALLMFTDGLIERRGEGIDVSLARLAALRVPAGAPLGVLLDEVAGRLVQFPLGDDVALLAARVR